MFLNKMTTTIVATVSILAVVATAMIGCNSQSDQGADYSAVPFKPVPTDYPRIIVVQESPQNKEKPGWDEYWQKRKAVARYLTEEGAVARASEDERAAIQAAAKNEHVRAREFAVKVLRNSSNSIPALLVLAKVEAFGDGNLPRGLYLVRRARQLCEQLGRKNADDADAREWYLRALDREYDILGDLDRRQEQLQVVQQIEQIYEPLPWLKIWPLMKLRRYDDARLALEQTAEDGRWPLRTMNSLCALETELQNREASFQAGQAMVEQFEKSPVLWSNHGLAALGVFRLDEAEKAYLTSVKAGRPDFAGTAYGDLCILYLQQGRITEALDALLKAKGHRAARKAFTLQQDHASIETAKAMLMLVLGRSKQALDHARPTYETPDRGGAKSDDEDVLRVSSALAYWSTLRSHIEQLRESGESTRELDLESWMLRRKARKLIDREMLISTLRPYLAGGPHVGIGVPSWLRVSVVQFFPAGVAAEAIQQARQVEDHPKAVPYLDAADAEVQLRLGNTSQALELAQRAIDELPPEGEKTLRARVAVVAAEAAYRLGKKKQALDFFEHALTDFPQAIRLLRAELPVSIQHDDHMLSAKLAKRIVCSPRFREDSEGFVIKINVVNNRLRIEMFRQSQSRLFQEEIELPGEKGHVVQTAIDTVHERALSPPVDLTQQNINSLDGSPSVARARDQVDRLLDLVKPEKAN